MKISMRCRQCDEEGRLLDKDKKVPYVPSYPYWEYPIIELTNTDNYYEFDCRKGHKNIFIIQSELYELLFQQATYCITDGYYRESISTLSSSVERFMEYCIEILYMIDNFNGVDFSEYWKLVSQRSERQIGAFYLIWSKHFGEMPDILENKKIIGSKTYTNIRNSVVHKGEMVSKEEAYKFGEAVFEFIRIHKNKLDSELFENNEMLPGLRMFRNMQNSKRISKAYESGEEVWQVSAVTFLNRKDSIIEFEDCFKEENNLDYGILK